MEGEVDEQNLSGHMKESGNGKSVGGGGGAGDGFVDRSKVRILLCDNDAKSSQEVFTLLLKCSYQGNLFLFYFFSFTFPSRECYEDV
jgi:pseudo-response regulator 1